MSCVVTKPRICKNETIKHTEVTYHPAVPSVPPTPGVPATPAKLAHDFNIGWNSGAISGAAISGDCDFVLSVNPSSIGVVAGINRSNNGVGYKEIEHGLYFSRGKATVYESGSAKTSAFYFVSGDSFTVRRSGRTVSYLKNSTTIYTSLVDSSGIVFADSSLYMGGDTIDFASFSLAEIQHSTSSASFFPIGGTASDKYVCSSSSSMLAIAGNSYNLAHGISAASMPPLSGSAANKTYSSSHGKLLPITTTSNSGDLNPGYAISNGSLAYLIGSAHGITGELGISYGSFYSIGGLSSDRPYASSSVSLQPLGAFSTFIVSEDPGIRGGASLAIPSINIYATGHDSTGENSFSGTLPMLDLIANCGANAILTLNGIELTANATSTNLGHSSLNLPGLSIEAYATTGGVSSANLVIPGAFNLVGYSGSVCEVTIGGFTIAASGITGAVGRASLTIPLFELESDGTSYGHASAELTLPAFQAGDTAQSWLALPGMLLTAVGTATVAATFEAYAVNLQHTADADGVTVDEVTRYTNFPFTHVVRYQNSYFGANSTGLYLLEGTTDAGAAIPYEIETHPDTFGHTGMKTAVSAYFSGRIDPELTAKIVAGQDAPQTYSYTSPRGATAQAHRVKFGRGVKDRYLAVGLAGDGVLELDEIELEIQKLKRRI